MKMNTYQNGRRWTVEGYFHWLIFIVIMLATMGLFVQKAQAAPIYENIASYTTFDGTAFKTPGGIAIDADGKTYVSDYDNDRVVICIQKL